MHRGEDEIELQWEGRTRRTIVYRPPPRSPQPALLLAFHGSGVNARRMVEFSGLNEAADRFGFVVAYPNGEGRIERARSWNAGMCCGHAKHHELDDVGYIAHLLDRLTSNGEIDLRRIYATGMSNGAMMCYRLANELSSRIAAIAPVAGPMALLQVHPQHAVPVCHFHGDEDDFTPFGGGRGLRSVSQVEFLSVDYTIQSWVAANGCQKSAVTKVWPQRVNDGTRITEERYQGGRDNSEVVLYTIHGGGHVWPGRDSGMAMLGRATQNIDANEVMWRFFASHSREP